MSDTIGDWTQARLRAFIQSESRNPTAPEDRRRGTNTVIEAFGGLDMPVGTILAWGAKPVNDAGVAIDPPGWLVCDGRVKKKAEYPKLSRVCLNLWDNGASIGADEFVIPDLRKAFIIGQDFDRPDGGTSGSAEAGNISQVIVDPASGTTFPLAILTFFIKY